MGARPQRQVGVIGSVSDNQTPTGSIDEARVRRFEAAWAAGSPEPLTDFLPPDDDPSCLPTLEEMVHVELEFAWNRWANSRRLEKQGRGQSADAPPLLERYLEEFPDLDDTQRLGRLLQQEYFHRLDCGINSPLAEYCRRFPALVGNEEEAAILLQQENSLVDQPTLTPTDNQATLDTTGLDGSGTNEPTLAPRPVSLSGDGMQDEVRDVAGYRVIGELGRGGMGVVYKALDPKLNRIVALKMVLAGDHASQNERERFQREARAIAQLQHPNIVQIFEVGEENDLPFFVLEFIRGGSLDRQIDGRPRNPRQAADLVATLALTMQVAHQQGIVHRDLKPANVLMAPQRVPKITDFGLAKQLEDSQANTATGDVIGTPSYMAPEQAAGEPDKIGPGADIYALGAILYTLVTGRPPFQGETSFDTIMQVIEQEPVRPTVLQSKIPRDLETICLKCLQKDPHRRYTTAQDLADDLRRFLDRRPILARPTGWVEHGIKWIRRKPTTATLVALLVLSPLIGWGFIVNQQTIQSQQEENQGLGDLAKNEIARANKATADANRKTEQLQESTKELQQSVVQLNAEKERLGDARYKADMGMAASDWDQHNLKRLDQRLSHHEFPGGTTDRRQFEWFFWKRRSRQDLRTFHGHTLAVVSLACSPDGTWIASGSLDKTIRIWNTTTGKILHTLQGHTRPVSHVAISHDGKTLLSSGLDGTARFWTVQDGKQIALVENVSRGEGIAFSPDGKTIAIAHDDKSIRFWTPTGQPLPQSIRPRLDDKSPRTVGPLTISNDGRFLAAGCSFNDPTVAIFDLAKQTQLDTRSVNWPRIFDLAFSPDGKQIAIAGRGVQLWDINSGSTRSFKPHGRSAIRSVRFHGSGQRLVSAGIDNAINSWDIDSPAQATTRLGHQRPVISLALHPDGKHLFSGSDDNTIKSWAITADRGSIRIPEQWKSEQVIQSVSRMTPGLDNDRVFVGTDDGTLLTVDLATGVEQVQKMGKGQVMSLVAVPGSGHVVSGFRSGQVVVWDPRNNRPVHSLTAHDGIVYAVAVSSDGRRLATGGQDQKARLWDLANGAPIHDLPWDGNQVRGLAFHPRKQQLVAAGRFGDSKSESVILWDYQTRKTVRTFEVEGAFRFHCVTISDDGKWLSAGDSRGGIWVWDLATGSVQSTCSGHTADVRSLQFSPNSQRLSSSGSDGTVRLWDPVDGTELLNLGDEGGAPDVFFSSDGQQMISLSPSSRTIHIRDGRPLSSATARQASPAEDAGQ